MLVVVALVTPLAGIVYVLDGVLIGAGDSRYLALAGVLALIAYAPLALIVAARRQRAGLAVDRLRRLRAGAVDHPRAAGARHRVDEGGRIGLTDRDQGWKISGRAMNQVLDSRPFATRAPIIMVSPGQQRRQPGHAEESGHASHARAAGTRTPRSPR